jgi:hypothetical protein
MQEKTSKSPEPTKNHTKTPEDPQTTRKTMEAWAKTMIGQALAGMKKSLRKEAAILAGTGSWHRKLKAAGLIKTTTDPLGNEALRNLCQDMMETYRRRTNHHPREKEIPTLVEETITLMEKETQQLISTRQNQKQEQPPEEMLIPIRNGCPRMIVPIIATLAANEATRHQAKTCLQLLQNLACTPETCHKSLQPIASLAPGLLEKATAAYQKQILPSLKKGGKLAGPIVSILTNSPTPVHSRELATLTGKKQGRITNWFFYSKRRFPFFESSRAGYSINITKWEAWKKEHAPA